MKPLDREWKPIKGYEGLYEISEYGDIYSIKNKKVKKQTLNCDYNYITLNKSGKPKTFRVHRLVLKHFVSEPPFEWSRGGHKDNVKTNNHYSNLYWTTTQENTKKAIEDGLMVSKKGHDNPTSKYIKVIDVNSGELVGVYGSIRECERCIENVTSSYISKMLDKPNYKPRNKKYIYQLSNVEEYLAHETLQQMKLIENEIQTKKPKLFIMKNDKTGYCETLDNQKQVSKVCGIPQASISHLISTNGTFGDWSFIEIGRIDDVKKSTAYRTQIENNAINNTIENIYTGEIYHFKTINEAKQFLQLDGNDLGRYIKENKLIKSQWKIIRNNM